MSAPQLRGIDFPGRAEYLHRYKAYKVFLDPWEPIAQELRVFFDGVMRRRESRILAIYGPQGTGKTLLATKLAEDFALTKGSPRIEPDSNNLWHRICGGRMSSRAMIEEATRAADVRVVANTPEWVETTTQWLSFDDRRCIVLADDAEADYFRLGLVPTTIDSYLRLSTRPEFTAMAAERLVALCRGAFQGSLLIVLSNRIEFLTELDRAVQAQHAGLLKLVELPLPDGPTKEAVVRVNINRLNEVSYWHCLDRGSHEERLAVKRALEGASTFPESFQAVDNAIREAAGDRAGRNRQNLLTLFVLTGVQDATIVDPGDLGTVSRELLVHRWCAAYQFDQGWAPQEIGERDAGLLESEWALRVVVLGTPFVASLQVLGAATTGGAADGQADVSEHADACRKLLALFKTVLVPRARQTTRDAYASRLRALVDAWPPAHADLDAFWELGQVRSRAYELGLARVLPDYNTKGEGFMHYRPDFVAAGFKPCSILASISDAPTAIDAAIRRTAHAFEFTANRQYSAATVKTYLAAKLRNYVEVTQEQ